MARIIKIRTTWLWYGLGRKSPSSHLERPGLIPAQSIWDLWWTMWHWDRCFSKYFGFPQSVSFHEHCILIHLLPRLI